VSVAIKKVEGVDSVKVSLNQGVAVILFRPGNRVTAERIRDLIRDNGFTPKGADVRIAGKVIERGGKPALTVTGLDLVYLLVDHPDTKGKVAELQKVAMGRQVTLRGHLPETAKDAGPEKPRNLQLRDFALEGE
jgi:copper chaperone CopZ